MLIQFRLPLQTPISIPTTKFKPINATTTSAYPPPRPPPPPSTTDSGLLFRQKIQYLEKLEINPTKALEKNPNFRSTPLQTLKSVETCLSSMGIERSAFGRIFEMYPQLLTADPYLHLYPILDFLLHDVGISFHDVRKSILRCPRILISSVDDQLKPALSFLRNLGFNPVTYQNTVLLVSNVENTLIPKMDFLEGLGYSRKYVDIMVLRSPAILTYSIEKNLKPKADYFFKEMNGNLGELKKFPQFFCFSLEGKIKRRHKMLVEMGIRLSLRDMLLKSDGEFQAQMVDRQLQLLDNVGMTKPDRNRTGTGPEKPGTAMNRHENRNRGNRNRFGAGPVKGHQNGEPDRKKPGTG